MSMEPVTPSKDSEKDRDLHYQLRCFHKTKSDMATYISRELQRNFRQFFYNHTQSCEHEND